MAGPPKRPAGRIAEGTIKNMRVRSMRISRIQEREKIKLEQKRIQEILVAKENARKKMQNAESNRRVNKRIQNNIIGASQIKEKIRKGTPLIENEIHKLTLQMRKRWFN